ncbi:hypothetical protein AXK57_20760 [Tsukamurella pulmonis]|uniref:hypothetical protein n=1 Tax=Tsukamurella pulmonis TaxID=47312 RepID=UPI000796645C|nr:hypothetical protein [Tsukamurella pulmonis]KXP11994.1 hypothetical protein AXK57_20760 [Tsukamurella pulmonis]
MSADDAGLALAWVVLGASGLYIGGQLVRAEPEVFGPIALALLGLWLLAALIRWHQRAMRRVRDLSEASLNEAGRMFPGAEDIVRERHEVKR